MKKIILQGYDVGDFSNQQSIVPIYKGNNIEAYLAQRAPEAREIFIYAHGSQYFSHEHSLPQLSLTLQSSNNELVPSILSKITENTEENKPNIVHILSCHASTAHYNMQNINGNIVLCTYAPANYVSNGYVAELLFNTKNNFDNLNDFIVKKLPLLTAISFGISYKLDENVYPLIFDNSSIKGMDINSFSGFLQEQYIKVQKFYTNLQEKYVDKYPELFPEYNFPEKISYSTEELKQAFNVLLNLDSEKLSIEEIQHLLAIDNSHVGNILADAIKCNRTDAIEVVINTMKEATTVDLHSAVKFNNLAVLNRLLDKTEKVENCILQEAIQEHKIEIAEMLINSNKIKSFTNDYLLVAINANNLPILKILLNKEENIVGYLLYRAAELENINTAETVELLFDKTKETDYFINTRVLLRAVKENCLSLINKVIGRMNEFDDIPDGIFDSVIERGNTQIIKILLEKIASFDFLIKAINSNNLPAVEDILKTIKVENKDIAAIIMSGNTDMFKILANKIGDDKILDIAIKLGDSSVVNNILDEKEKQGILDSNKLDEIFETAIKNSNGNVIEDIMNRMPEVTGKHLTIAMQYYAPERAFIFDKVYNSIKQIEHNLILTAIDSGIPDVIQKLVSKLGDQEKASILYDILGSSDIVKNMVVSNILLNNIAKIPDNYKR
ncbi:MAG: ankyrin repeat domain-containing protein [Rickettsia endosymbiont of Stiretrus anchorago]|nr:ankyrin repeat domain-containing protein [Rickettsia endosymbiont of Stiretrus anchorago]